MAKAYLDQLNRTKGIQPERATAVTAALERADKVHSSKDKAAAAVAQDLDTLAAAVDGDAGNAPGPDAMRLRSLAATIKGRAATLK